MPSKRFLLIPALATSVLASCISEAPDISLEQLARQQALYDGREVSARGVLRRHGSPPHYWIEDGAGNRVELMGVPQAATHLGRTLRVRGTFLYAADRGRRIEVENLEVLP